MKSSDSSARSLAKTISYHSAMIVADIAIVLTLTGKLDLALGFILLTNTASALLYFSNERLWNLLGWGKTKSRR